MPFKPGNVWETYVDVLSRIEIKAALLGEADLNHGVTDVLDCGLPRIPPRRHHNLSNEQVNAPGAERQDRHHQARVVEGTQDHTGQ